MNRGFTIATVVVILMAAISAVTLYNAQSSSLGQYLAGGAKLVYTVEEGRTETVYAQEVDGELKITWNHGSVDGDSTNVEEHHGGKRYTYSSPNTDFLIGLVNGDDELDAAKKEALIAGYESFRGEKAECIISDKAAPTYVGSDAGLTIINDGQQIVYEDKTFDIVSIGPMSADELASAFNGCSDDARDLVVDIPNARKLGFAEWVSGTDWCGAGTDNKNTVCPGKGTGSWEDNIPCRRHDHGVKYSTVKILGLGIGARLECQVDKDLLDGCSDRFDSSALRISSSLNGKKSSTRAWASIHAVFGSAGLAATWGCYNEVPNCWWECGWRGCRRRCSGSKWEVKRGPFRYWRINNRRGAMYKPLAQSCENDPVNWNGWNR